MKRQKYPLPRRYWLYAGLSVALSALLFVNVFVPLPTGRGSGNFGHTNARTGFAPGRSCLPKRPSFFWRSFSREGRESSFAAIPRKMRNTRSSFASRAYSPGNTPACGLISRVGEGR